MPPGGALLAKDAPVWARVGRWVPWLNQFVCSWMWQRGLWLVVPGDGGLGRGRGPGDPSGDRDPRRPLSPAPVVARAVEPAEDARVLDLGTSRTTEVAPPTP